MSYIPHEFAFGGIFMPPLLVARPVWRHSRRHHDSSAQPLSTGKILFLSAIGVPGVDGYLYRVDWNVYCSYVKKNGVLE